MNRVPYSFGTPAATAAPERVAPTLASATVAANGSSVLLAFSEPVAADLGVWDELFYLTTEAGQQALTLISGDGSDGTVTLFAGAYTVYSWHTVTLDYTLSPAVKDLAGNALANFADFPVANDSEQ